LSGRTSRRGRSWFGDRAGKEEKRNGKKDTGDERRKGKWRKELEEEAEGSRREKEEAQRSRK